MGWYGSYKNQYRDRKDYIKREIMKQGNSNPWKPVDHSSTGNEVWVLYRKDNGDTLLECNLVRTTKNEYMNKSMTLNMGPYYYNCPARLVKQCRFDGVMATQTVKNWLEKWADHNATETKIKKAKLTDGVVVRYDSPITFTGGAQLDTFAVRIIAPFSSKGKSTVYYFPVQQIGNGGQWLGYCRYRIRGVKVGYKVVGKIVGEWNNPARKVEMVK
jgi:hypothetical protein